MAPKHRLYTPEIAETILEELADGKSLRDICEQEGMPSRGAVREWVQNDHDGFAARYASARARGLEHLSDDILSIADTARDSDSASAARVRVDSRKWLLSKLLPKIYGDRLDLNHSGEVAIKDISDDALEQRLQALVKQMQGADGP